MNLQELHEKTKKYENDPPAGHLCERCGEQPCERNEYGKMMWICGKCAEINTPLRPNKAQGTSAKRRHYWITHKGR